MIWNKKNIDVIDKKSNKVYPFNTYDFAILSRLGIYYTISMFEIGLAMACNCFILNLYYRNYPMSSWVRRLILDKLAKVTRVHVPHARTQAYIESVQNFSRTELSPLREIPLTSMDQNSTAIDNENNIDNTHDTKFTTNSSCNGTKSVSPPTRKRRALLATLKRENSSNTAQSSVSSDAMLCAKPFVSASNSILEDQKLQAEDWKLVARVLDRILLGVSVVIGVMSAFIIFFQAERFREMFSWRKVNDANICAAGRLRDNIHVIDDYVSPLPLRADYGRRPKFHCILTMTTVFYNTRPFSILLNWCVKIEQEWKDSKNAFLNRQRLSVVLVRGLIFHLFGINYHTEIVVFTLLLHFPFV